MATNSAATVVFPQPGPAQTKLALSARLDRNRSISLSRLIMLRLKWGR